MQNKLKTQEELSEMKRMEVKTCTIGENTYYINPFPAFTAASIGGELTALLAPVFAEIIPAMSDMQDGEKGSVDDGQSILNTDINDVLPALANAAAELSGEKIAHLMGRLLIESGNVAVQGDATNGATVKLTKDLADEIFCMDLQGMFTLCYEVVKMNFGGTFERLSEKARVHAAVNTKA